MFSMFSKYGKPIVLSFSWAIGSMTILSSQFTFDQDKFGNISEKNTIKFVLGFTDDQLKLLTSLFFSGWLFGAPIISCITYLY
jgi:hypothetical protein